MSDPNLLALVHVLDAAICRAISRRDRRRAEQHIPRAEVRS